MCDTIRHRGPDGAGFHFVGELGMGMRRLAVIDVEGGDQPIYNEDGTIAVMCNGEIYNYRELRHQLCAKGHVFATNSDIEVIVHAYEAFGDDFPTHLNGMFAIALHDLRRNRLVLARDHVGIKPLYYSLTEECVVWGSEVKAILASSLIRRELDMLALGEFLAWEYVPGPRTLFKGIHKLEAASMLIVDLEQGKAIISTFWDVPVQDLTSTRSEGEWMELVAATLRRCVQRQLVSDVPLGAFLSGGVDSSMVAAAMGSAQTFSIGFSDPAYDELPWAKQVALHLGLDNINEVTSPDVVDLYSRLMYHLDDPVGDFSIFPTYLVSQLARRHVTVSLSGDGGDELFGGYETYSAERLSSIVKHVVPPVALRPMLSWLKRLPASRDKRSISNRLARLAGGMTDDPSLSHARWRHFAGRSQLSALLSPEAYRGVVADPDTHIHTLFSKAGARDGVNRSLYVDFKSYLPDCILTKVDRMSMAVSLEARVPLLDKELVELAFQVPGHLKVRGLRTKYLLKCIAAQRIPRECVYRPKRGFSVPLRNWLMNSLRPLMEDLLDSDEIRAQGIFNARTIDQLRAEHTGGRANHSHLLWSLMVFQSWHREWLEA